MERLRDGKINFLLWMTTFFTPLSFAIDFSDVSVTSAVNDLTSKNLIAINDLEARFSIQGKAVVAGNLSGQSTSFGTRLQNTQDIDTLIVGGDVSGGSKNINNQGNIRVGGQAISQINLNGSGAVINDLSLNFSGLQQRHILLSESLVSIESSGQVSILDSNRNRRGPAVLTANPNESRVSVINIVDGAELFNNDRVQNIDVISNDSKAIIINVGGTDINFNRRNFSGSTTTDDVSKRILWNFYEAQSLKFERSFEGSILVPFAFLENRSRIDGSVIVNNLVMNSSIGLPTFDGAESLANALESPNGGDVTSNVIINYFIDEDFDNPDANRPAASSLTILVDGEEVDLIGDDAILTLSLEPGEHEILAFSVGEFAASTIIVVEEDEITEEDVFLKSEGLASILNHNFQIIGADSDVVLDQSSLVLASVGTIGQFTISDFSHIRVARIENGSFREGVGGLEVGRGIFLTNEFDLIDGVLVASNPVSVFNSLRSLGVGEYILDIGAVDAESGLPLDDVIKVVLGEFSISGQLDGPFSLSDRVIQLTSADRTVSRTAVTDSNGNFSFDGLPPAIYQISSEITDDESEVRLASGLVRLFENRNVTLKPITLSERINGASEIIDEVTALENNQSGSFQAILESFNKSFNKSFEFVISESLSLLIPDAHADDINDVLIRRQTLESERASSNNQESEIEGFGDWPIETTAGF